MSLTQNVFGFDQPLTGAEQVSLRSQGLLSESEIAVRAGDLLIAVNTLTGTRRALSSEGTLSESTQRRLLRD
jgi:hypothetical protein